MSEIFSGRVAVLGLGYIGLPTAAALAGCGIEVVGVDTNPAVVAAVAAGQAPMSEPGLSSAVHEAVERGRLSVSTETPNADAYIIAVPTPFHEDHTADLTYIKRACEQIAPRLQAGETVILESTSPPGTTEQVSRWIGELRPDLHLPHDPDHAPDVFVAHCPERVLPGQIMLEMLTNERVVGGLTARCAQKAAAIYRTFCRAEIHCTDASSAEMSKLVENSYRDVNIAFANELSLVCEQLHLDVWKVISLANRHPRVNVLTPGPGVGGHCIAVDPWFIVAAAPGATRLIRTAREVNDSKPHHIAAEIVKRCERFKTPVVACLGLTFKANVDDTRGSPAVEVVHLIASNQPDVELLVADPYVRTLPDRLRELPNVHLSGAIDALERADIVVLLVEHDQFRALGEHRTNGKVVYDTRGAWR